MCVWGGSWWLRQVAAAIEALRVLEARPLPRSRDENWHEFEALATAFANKLAAVADAAAAAAAAAGAAVGAAASSPSTSNALPVPAPLSEVGEGGTLMLSNATPPTDGAAAGHTAVAGPAPIAAATGQISVPPIEASSDGGHIIEKPQNVPPTSSFCSFMAKSTQVLAWDANHAGGVTTANAYPATVLDVRPAVTPSATSLNVDKRNKTVPATCSSNDTVQPPASSGSNSMRYSNPNEFEVCAMRELLGMAHSRCARSTSPTDMFVKACLVFTNYYRTGEAALSWFQQALRPVAAR